MSGGLGALDACRRQSLSDLGPRADAEPSVIGDHRLDQLEIGLAGEDVSLRVAHLQRVVVEHIVRGRRHGDARSERSPPVEQVAEAHRVAWVSDHSRAHSLDAVADHLLMRTAKEREREGAADREVNLDSANREAKVSAEWTLRLRVVLKGHRAVANEERMRG